jgi:hypothetical protein
MAECLRPTAALVFACGLLQQAMFVVAILVGIALAKRIVPTLVSRAPKRLASAASLALGVGFFVQVLVSMA